ncbi:MAG: leucyl aminopeptidase [Thermodesulfovibrio sp.]|nr:leucyl aminopeptidase [Thermodesulfovibrio sp.]
MLLNIHIKNIRENECVCDALILPAVEGISVNLKALGASVTALMKRISAAEFQGKKNELLLIPAPADIRPKRILLVGLGKKEAVNPETVRQAGGKALGLLRNSGISTAALSAAMLSDLALSPAYFIEGGLLGLYTYDCYKKEKETRTVRAITVLTSPSKSLDDQLRTAEALASGVCFARDLVNAPSNDMTPSDMAKAALSLKGKNMVVRVLEKKACEKLGMGSYLSVSKGSAEPPKFIILEYNGAAKPPVVLIGKSVTFDSGGINIKPSDGLEKMKYDMAGGAAVLGIMKAAAALQLPVNLIGILPATENLPGGHATRPGDIVTSIDGRTIEIINTDAEGRLTLADALGFAKKYKPSAVIDIATLTGACSIALGNETIALMGTDRSLVSAFRQSADFTNEKVWEMPLYDEYLEYLKSDVADIKNIGGRTGSLVTSACFLKEFAGELPWVHLDIAGTAWTEKDRPYTPKGASGVGVRLIFDLLLRLKGKAA